MLESRESFLVVVLQDVGILGKVSPCLPLAHEMPSATRGTLVELLILHTLWGKTALSQASENFMGACVGEYFASRLMGIPSSAVRWTEKPSQPLLLTAAVGRCSSLDRIYSTAPGDDT